MGGGWGGKTRRTVEWNLVRRKEHRQTILARVLGAVITGLSKNGQGDHFGKGKKNMKVEVQE